jgi:hypothetical protein
MSRKNYGRWTLAATLAATLMAATPAQAVSLGGWVDASGMFLRAWQWLAGGAAARPVGTGRVVTKGGLHIDPNGLTKAGPGSDPNGSHGTGTSPATNSIPSSDAGMGVDPNGG